MERIEICSIFVQIFKMPQLQQIPAADTAPQRSMLNRTLILIFCMVFTEFIIMGVSLSVLPAYVHQTLKLSNIWVGVVIGMQYVATLATRQFAGKTADHRGARVSVRTGLVASALCGLFLFGATWLTQPWAALTMLLMARVLLGIGESFLIVGVFSWGFTLVGPSHTGKVMVWNGMGMYAGMAAGAPLAALVLKIIGLKSLFLVTVALPGGIYLIVQLLPVIPLPTEVKKLPFYKAVGLVWGAGSALALASIGFGGIASFISLYFLQHQWPGASLALTAFGAGYIVVRLFLSHAPDQYGGVKVVFYCLAVEIVGQLLLWQSASANLAIGGAALTGIGMSLIFPSLGQIAVKKVEAANRGMAIAAYNAFFDLGLGITGPLAGWIAGKSHYQYVYLFGTLAAVASMVLVVLEHKRNGRD